MSHLNAKSKLDVLQKYLTPAQGNKKVKPNSIPQNQLRVHDYELEGLNRGFQDGDADDDAPLVVETPDSVKIDFDLKSKVLRGELGKSGNKPFQPKTSGKWVSVSQPVTQPANTAQSRPIRTSTIVTSKEKEAKSESESDESSDEERRRKRHDTESEGGEESEEENEDEDKDVKKMKRDMRTALGIPSEKKDQKGDDDDIEVVRKTDVGTTNAGERKIGGLRTVQELKNEAIVDKEKQNMINKLAESFKDTQTIYRDKEGKRINIFKDLATKKQEKLKKNEDRIKEWSGGVLQKKEAQDRKNKLKTVNEDFSKTGVSKEYDTQLMEKRRFGDTMAPVIEKPKKEPKETKETKQMPKIRCKFPGIPNRFGIEPGRMWDGVDRGSDYERRFMAKINERKDKEEMARTWAMQEM